MKWRFESQNFSTAPMDPTSTPGPSARTSTPDPASSTSGDEVSELRRRLAEQDRLIHEMLAARSGDAPSRGSPSGSSGTAPVAPPGITDSVRVSVASPAAPPSASWGASGSTSSSFPATSATRPSPSTRPVRGAADSATSSPAVESEPPPGLSDEELALWFQEQEARQAARAPAVARGGPPALAHDRDDVDEDLRMAQELQTLELAYATRVEAVPAAPAPRTIEDPVWGTFTLPEGQAPSPLFALGVSCCPCCVRPCCIPVRKAAWRRFVLSWSFGFSLLQLALVLASLGFRGFAPVSVNPMLGCYPDTLSYLGAKNAAEIVYRHAVHRFLTPIFLHAGLIHLATNLLMQLRVGILLEVRWGWRTFLTVYLLGGLFASFASTVFLPNQIAVGASGALMATLGAWMVQMLMHWGLGTEQEQWERTTQFILCVVNVAIVLSFSAVQYIDWAAHLGGFLGGVFVGLVLFPHQQQLQHSQQQQQQQQPVEGEEPRRGLGGGRGGGLHRPLGGDRRAGAGTGAEGRGGGGGAGFELPLQPLRRTGAGNGEVGGVTVVEWGAEGELPRRYPCWTAETRRMLFRWAGFSAYLVLAATMLAYTFAALEPTRELLDICAELQRSFPDLTCPA